MRREKNPPRPDPAPRPTRYSASLILPPLLLLGAFGPGLLLVGAAVALGLAFLCSLYENALQHYSRVRVTAEAQRLGSEQEIDRVLLHEDEIFFASKIGRGITQMTAVSLLAVRLVEQRPPAVAVAGWAVGFCLLYLFVNVAGPYVLGRRYADGIVLRGLLPYSRALVVLRPLSALLHRGASKILPSGQVEEDPAEELADEILSAVEEGTREGTLEHTEKRMIEGVIDLREVTAGQIMTPRTEMICIPFDATVADAVERARERGLSRLPVYRGTPDDIVGILYTKDLLPYLGGGDPPSLERLVRRPFLIPQSKLVRELLQEMRARQVHLAIVLDEYGGTAGLVTIEDILEEIVGEIADEHEAETPAEMVKLNANAASVEGRTPIDDLNRALDLDLPESEEYETVGGLLFTRLGRVPSSGEHVEVHGVRFTVEDADERRVHRVRVEVERGIEVEGPG